MHNKQWSKVKKKLESYICHCLKNRVDFYLTNYRRTHDQTGRAFIIVDNKEVLNMCSIIAEKAVVKKKMKLEIPKILDMMLITMSKIEIFKDKQRN
ncbi:hypothetical protein AAHH67_27265 [Niallia circulans]